MANNCSVDAKITGKAKNVRELIDMMSRKGQYEHDGLGRVFECWYDDDDFDAAHDDDIVDVHVYLDVAWSIVSSMREYAGRERSLESETKRLNLVFEAYSSEPGCQFQEHVLIDRGDVLIDECVDYEEHWVEDYDTIEAYNEEFGTNFTEDMINCNGDVCIGGFGDEYGNFEYFCKEHFEEA